MIRAKEERFLRLEAQHTHLLGKIAQVQHLIDAVLKVRIEKYDGRIPECIETLAGAKLLNNTVTLYRLSEAKTPTYDDVHAYDMYGPARKPAEQ